jgi:two-component system response regulator BaeR
MNTTLPRIIYAEDEADIASVVTDYLVHAGYTVEHYANGTEALAALITRPPALAILDLMLPGADGLSILRECRARQLCPVICLTAKVEEVDRLIGLEMGADDYICKPFSPRELVARVKVVLRRYPMLDIATSAAPQSDWRLDEATCQASWRGQDLGLTRREFSLLLILQRHPGKIYPRSQLLDLAYADALEVSDRAIDSHIKNLRKKLRTVVGEDTEHIRSVYGVGFAFEP